VTGAGDAGSAASGLQAETADLVLVFGAVELFGEPGLLRSLQQAAPGNRWAGCSTAGEIAGALVYDHSLVLTALNFEHEDSCVRMVTTHLADMADSQAAGQRLGQSLLASGLRAVLLLGLGVAINGSALVAGLKSELDGGVQISGGLAADAGAFKQTWTLCDSSIDEHQIVAIGLYGSQLLLDNSSFGGWEPFGPERKVTRSKENVLYELDQERALDIYQRYLGDYARDLPGSGLLFPFEMLGADRKSHGVIRTMLAFDQTDGSLTLAGDIDPQGYLKLMHASTDRLIEGAEKAAEAIAQARSPDSQTLAVLVSCVGRRLVMGDRVDEELEAVVEILGANTVSTGFYSNGEISETASHSECRLFNQTMTITLIGER
jgi:hypothetical protein